jgi:hypothetical protein
MTIVTSRWGAASGATPMVRSDAVLRPRPGVQRLPGPEQGIWAGPRTRHALTRARNATVCSRGQGEPCALTPVCRPGRIGNPRRFLATFPAQVRRWAGTTARARPGWERGGDGAGSRASGSDGASECGAGGCDTRASAPGGPMATPLGTLNRVAVRSASLSGTRDLNEEVDVCGHVADACRRSRGRSACEGSTPRQRQQKSSRNITAIGSDYA